MKRFWINLFLSLLLGGGFLALSIISFDIDWKVIPSHLMSLNPFSLLFYVLLYFLVHFIRVLRWYFLVKPLGERNIKRVIHACAIGFAAIVILPLRLGEFVRPYLISKNGSLSMSSALGTVVVERVIDGLSITLLLFLTLVTYSGGGETQFLRVAGYSSLAIFLTSLTLIILMQWHRELTVKLIQGIGRRVSVKLTEKVVYILDGFIDGFNTLKSAKNVFGFFLCTLAYWGINGFAITILARGFGIDLGIWAGFTVLSILVIGIMIPGGPGFTGNYEFFIGKGLILFVPAATMATAGVAFVATIHLVQFVVQVAFGIPFYLSDHLGFKGIINLSDKSAKISSEPTSSTPKELSSIQKSSLGTVN